jgi:hypothetical protein
MARRNRTIYASQSVFCNGEVLYRVQTMGSTTTFNSTDIFELGHLDLIDVVDDVPAVAVTINTNDWGDVKTFAILAQVSEDKLSMTTTASGTNANLAVVSGTQYTQTGDYLHGACIADFAITCGNLPGVTMWSPVQSECDMGTLANNIDQTMLMDAVFVNKLDINYSTGADSTENYTAETDNKMWLLNDAKFVNYSYYHLTAGQSQQALTVSGTIATLSDGSLAFMRTDENGYRGVTFCDASANTATVYRTEAGTAATANYFVYNSATDVLYFPTSLTVADGDCLEVIYAADMYNGETQNTYFRALEDNSRYPIGTLRQGQVELYVVGPNDTDWHNAWRLTSAAISADMTREPLAELGHLAPYDRPLKLPVPITINLQSTAGDLENWAMFADKYSDYEAGTLDDLDLSDIMSTDYLTLVIKVYAQTDEEAGGTGSARKVLAGSELIGKEYQHNGTVGTYSVNDTEYPLKTIVVNNLKITEDGYNINVGANATQTFNFKTNNDLYMVKGGFDIDYLTNGHMIKRNVSS